MSYNIFMNFLSIIIIQFLFLMINKIKTKGSIGMVSIKIPVWYTLIHGHIEKTIKNILLNYNF